MRLNRYNSRVEAFTSNALLNITLSAKAVPPADLGLVVGDFTAQDCYPELTALLNLPRKDFYINDVPRILGVGVWSNMADGLMQNDATEDGNTGLVLRIRWQGYNSLGIKTQDDIDTNVIVKIPEFNTLYDMDHLFSAAGLDPTLAADAAASTRINASWYAATSDFATVSIDPAYQTKKLKFKPMLLIEHSRAMK